ncbi:adhesion G protein-coupled receptor E2-like [Malaclemys terrapin pileata]|uniref:adhesion G protein-coupled receptor E2-like n=1 Tax=Malaclemys terrapin pileata TaxID=2991368 RepID=UPI0023A853E6|nr:adhesion G protein-coupled receptor E2-like [Malaclemys terrapin pileata]
MRSRPRCFFWGLGFLLFCCKSALSGDYLTFDHFPLDDFEDVYSGSGSDSDVDCGPNAVPCNISHCICEDGFRSISGKEPFLGTSESSCEEIPLHCHSDFMRENDYVKMCLNGSQQIDLENRKNSSFCSLVNSTLRLLTPACENISLTTSLEETATSFEHVLADSSLWSVESKEEVASAATLFLQSLGSAAVTAALASPENQTQTVTTKLMAIQTKLTDENCSLQSKVLGFRAHKDRMDIHCTAVTDADMEGSAAVAFISYVGLESLLGGRFLQDENPGSEARPEQVHVNSRVVSASTSTWKKKLSSPINLTFQHLEDKTLLDRAICVHWNSTGQDGVWSPQGCQHLHSNVTHTRCSCRYLASFAVLMAPGIVQVDFALFVISQTGLIISLVCLVLAIVTFLFCHPICNTSSTFLHLQLSICLFLADLLFILGIDKTYNKLMCSITAGLLHYLFLACFAWMFLEAVSLYLIVRNLKVKNYAGTGGCTRKCMYAFGYGLPAVIVITSAASAPSSYGTPYHCWLNPDNGFRWNFLGPVCAVVVVNLVFFCLTLKLLREHLSSLNAELSTLRNTRSLTFKALAHLLVLGLTWGLGTFQFGPLATVMGYLFTITNSMLGTFIFVVHCLLNRKVREEYWKLFTRLRRSKEEPSSSNITMSALASSTATDPLQNSVPSYLQKAARN